MACPVWIRCFLTSRRPEPSPPLRIILSMKTIATVLVLSASLLVQAQTSAPKSAPAKSSAGKTSAARTTGPRPSLLNPASLTAKAPAVFKAKFTTTAGDFVVQVHRDWAPLGADRFYNLIRRGFFTNASFFRVVP